MNTLLNEHSTPVIARILIALVFLYAGWGKLTGFDGTVGYIAGAGLPFPEVLAIVAMIIEIGGGILLVLGHKVREAAIALAIFTIIASVAFHPFWSDSSQTILFIKNAAIVGGLLLIARGGMHCLVCKTCPA